MDSFVIFFIFVLIIFFAIVPLLIKDEYKDTENTYYENMYYKTDS